jgi:hypothetical protein
MPDGERFNLRKLNELEVRTQCQIEITNNFGALEKLNDDEDINRARENIKENIKTQLKRVYVCRYRSSINPGLLKNV